MDVSNNKPYPPPENAQAPITAEAQDGRSVKTRLLFAAIPIGRVFGVKACVSVYYILLMVFSGMHNPLFSGCWSGRMALLVLALSTAGMYVVAGIVECLVGRKFGAEPSAITVLPFVVLVSFNQLKLPRKGLVMTMMAWPLTILAFFIFWTAFFFLVVNAHGAPVGDCISWDHFLGWISVFEAVIAWFTLLVNLLLPIWPCPCFMAFCVLISKFGVSKKATLLRMGCVSIGLCAVGLIVALGFGSYSIWVELVLGDGTLFTIMLIINFLGMGYLFMSDSDGAAWQPFKFLKEESSDPEEMDGQPLLAAGASQWV
ncbi:hypothetical protein BSKO_10606 [Bryopsis sp. KO-2023]|nr:hypothetical protein BSKO_10606 [Bryopsis sp. KO-2023]